MKYSRSNTRRHKGIPSDRLRFRIYLASKRTMDLVLGGLLTILAIPILIICAVAVRIEGPGAIFYFQDRTGKSGRRFKMYKLRTMVHDADDLKDKYQHLNIHSYPDFKIPEDPRVTRVGRFLRKTSLDELPQLFNVIRGDMSLVGPRPTSFKASNYDIWHTARLEVIPGITGLWQISGRSNVGFDDRARLDVDYIRNRSLWLDLKILFRTFGSVIKRDGA